MLSYSPVEKSVAQVLSDNRKRNNEGVRNPTLEMNSGSLFNQSNKFSTKKLDVSPH